MPRPRTPLLQPNRYFSKHDGSPPLAHAALAVLVVAIATAAGVAVVLDQFTAALDVMITVDNPAYPGDPVCENPAYDDTPSGCEQPTTVERELGALVAEELSWVTPFTLVAVPFWWLFQGAVLHVASSLADADGPFSDTLVVAGWGMVPTLIRAVGVAAFVAFSFQSLRVPPNPDGALEAVRAASAGIEPVSLGLAVIAAIWAGVIRTYGLAAARDLRVSTAGLLVGTLTVVGLLFELV